MTETVQPPLPREVVAQDAARFSVTWDEGDRLARCEERRRAFLERFPRERLPRLSIDEFAGGIPGSFCDFLVCKHPPGRTCVHMDVGKFYLGGNVVAQAGVYSGERPGTFRTKRKSPPETVFAEIRRDLVLLIELLEQGEWARADRLPAICTLNQLKVCAGFMYLPDRVVPTDGNTKIEEFLLLSGLLEPGTVPSLRGLSWSEQSEFEFQWGRRLLDLVHTVPEIASWPTPKVADFVFDFHDRRAIHYPPAALGAWAIEVEAGEWSQWQTAGFAALPWPCGPVDDGARYEDFHERFVTRLRASTFGNRAVRAKAAAAATWAFRELPNKAPVIAFRRCGSKVQLVGIGVVTGGYEHRASPTPQHRRRVRWSALPVRAPEYWGDLRSHRFVAVSLDELAKRGVPTPGQTTTESRGKAPRAPRKARSTAWPAGREPEGTTRAGSGTRPDEPAPAVRAEEPLASGVQAGVAVAESPRHPDTAAPETPGSQRGGEPPHRADRPALPELVDVELLADLGRLRNRLEPKLRRLVKVQLKAHRGAGWILPLLETLPSERRSQCAGVDADEILSTRLFLLDLITVIHTQWGRYFTAFESGPPRDRLTKDQVKVLLDFVNAHRQDAHAGQITQGERAALQIAVYALERAIDRQLDVH